MLNVESYDLLMETQGALYQALGAVRARLAEPGDPPPPLLQLRSGYAESPGWFLVQAAEFDPEPLTVANLRIRDVYASERLVAALLALMASEEWLAQVEDGRYALAPAGRTILEQSAARRARLLAALPPLPAPVIAELADLLGRLVAASLRSPTPPGTWCLAHSRRRALGPESPALAQIGQFFDDFNAFRDDAHMAAWQPTERRGYVWEAFATLCSGAADSADSVAAHLAHRGYARREYVAALADLAAHGWLEVAAGPGSYRVTVAGRTVRAQVEHRTDAYFYAPWACLSDAEVAAVHAAQTRLRNALGALRA